MAQAPPPSPLEQIGARVRLSPLPAGDERQECDDPGQERATLTASTMQHRLFHLTGNPDGVDQCHGPLHRGGDRHLSFLGRKQRGVWLAWRQPGRPGDRIYLGGGVRGELGRHDRLSLRGPAQLGSQPIEPTAIEGRDHVDRGSVYPIARQPAAEVIGQHLSLLGIQSVGLVEDEPHPLGVGGQTAEIFVEALVVVLLGVDHPRHRVDARQEGIDSCPMFETNTVDVGQVEYGHPGQVGPVVADHALHTEPIEQGTDFFPSLVGHPGQRLLSGGSQSAGRADLLAGEGVEHRGFAYSGATDQCHHVELARKTKPLSDPVCQSPG